MAKDEAGNEIVEEKKTDGTDIIEELKTILAKKDEEQPKPPASQPSNDKRKAFMEANKITEETMRSLENGQITDQRLAIMELKANKKDFAVLEKDFMKEVEKYNKEYFRVVTPEVAQELFMAVKGRAVDEGRYTLPSSQPDRKVEKRGDREVISTRVTSFNAGAGGLSDDTEKKKSGADSLTDREKLYGEIIGVSPEEYAVEKERKMNGIREVADKAFKIPERINPNAPGVNGADVEYNRMVRQHGVRA